MIPWTVYEILIDLLYFSDKFLMIFFLVHFCFSKNLKNTIRKSNKHQTIKQKRKQIIFN